MVTWQLEHLRFPLGQASERGVGIAPAAWSLMLGADMKEVNELRGWYIGTAKLDCTLGLRHGVKGVVAVR